MRFPTAIIPLVVIAGVLLTPPVWSAAIHLPGPTLPRVHGQISPTPGAVWAWGADTDAQVGQPPTTRVSTPAQMPPPSGSPSPWTGLTAIAASHTTNANGSHSLAVRQSDGAVFAWGSNGFGELGLGNTVLGTTCGRQCTNTPMQVVGPQAQGGFLTGVVAVAAGEIHSLALKSDGTVWAWGDPSAGALGLGCTTGCNDTHYPQQVHGPGGSGFLTNVVSIAAGTSYSAAVLADGSAYAWGANTSGQLGLGSSPPDTRVPQPILGPNGAGVLSDVAQIAPGESHTLAVTRTTGAVYAWGANGNGQLGQNSLTPSNVPLPVLGGTAGGGALTGMGSIAAGANHSLAVRRTDGAVFSWGRGVDGELGTVAPQGCPVSACAQSPVTVNNGSGSGALTGAATVAAAFDTSYALTSGGSVFAWGGDFSGDLGDGCGPGGPVCGTSVVPVLARIGGVRAIAGGSHHALAIADATASNIVLDAMPTTIATGATLTVTWSGIPSPTGSERLVLAPAGTSNGSVTNAEYTSCSGTTGSPRAAGSCPLPVPANIAGGAYEVRLYSATNVRLATAAVTVQSPVTATPIATPPGSAGCTGSPRLLFTNWNIFTVNNGGAPPSFDTGGQRLCLVQINTYHWNNGTGATPGTLGLSGPGGAQIGPYTAIGMPGQGGVPNADWTANVPAGGPVILFGTYTVNDSDPATWSQNSISSGFGFASIYVNDPILTPTPTATATPTGSPTNTATATRTPTATPSPTPFPRPAVGVQVTPSAGTLQTTITARDANCSPNSQLQSIQFTRLANATVDVGMPLITTVTTTPRTVDLASHPLSIQLTVHRSNNQQPVTVEMTVTDGCGTWQTFVGGGPASF